MTTTYYHILCGCGMKFLGRDALAKVEDFAKHIPVCPIQGKRFSARQWEVVTQEET